MMRPMLSSPCRRLALSAVPRLSPLCTLSTPSRAFGGVALTCTRVRWCPASSQHDTSLSAPAAAASSSAASSGRGNFFAFFDLALSPELSVSELQRRYHNLQRRVHPDQKNVQAKAAAAEDWHGESDSDTSMYGNVAYETLRQPYSRCRYLLRLAEARHLNKGEPLTAAQEEALMTEDDTEIAKYRGLFNDKPLSEDFLMEMLAMNELIFAGDREDEAVRRQMQVLRADLESRDDDYFGQIKSHWKDQDWDQYRQTMMEWTYISNALRHLKDRQ